MATTSKTVTEEPVKKATAKKAAPTKAAAKTAAPATKAAATKAPAKRTPTKPAQASNGKHKPAGKVTVLVSDSEEEAPARKPKCVRPLVPAPL